MTAPVSTSGLKPATRTEAEAREEHRLLNERARQIAESDWRASGALLPFGYGFLSPKDREPFLARARAELSRGKE